MGTKRKARIMKISLEYLFGQGYLGHFEIQLQEQIFPYFKYKGKQLKDIANGKKAQSLKDFCL